MATPRRGGILAQPATNSASLSARKRKNVVFVDPTEESSSPDKMVSPQRVR